MRERELRAAATCVVCGQGVGHDNQVTFWRVKLEHYVMNIPALRRQTGLEMMMGGHVALAQTLSPDEEMARKMVTQEVTICEECFCKGVSLPAIIERLADSEESEEDDDTDDDDTEDPERD